MSSDTVLRATARDLLALVWFRLGYRPRDSLVLVGLHGPRRRSGLVARADLAPARLPEAELDEYARQLAVLLARDGADAAVLLVVLDGVLSGTPPPVVAAVRCALEDRRISVRDVLGVDAAAYRSLLCEDADCCPAGGHPLEALMSSEVAAHHVVRGNTVAASQEDLVADVVPSGDGASCRPAGGGPPDPAEQRLHWWDRWTAALADGAPEASEAAGLAVALRDKVLRDTVLISGIVGPAMGLRSLLADDDGAVQARAFGPGGAYDVDGLLSQPPDGPVADSLERARAVLAASARAAPPGRRADAIAVLAWHAWYGGWGARARLLVGRALEDDPSHLLARLLDQGLVAAARPPWVGGGGTAPVG